MKIPFLILVYLLCLNLATGIVMALTVPGTVYFGPTNTTGDLTDYEERFNATEMAKDWQASPFEGVPIFGDIFGGLYLIIKQVRFLIDGFPMFLNWVRDSYVTTSDGRLVFDVLANSLRVLFGAVMCVFIFEIITGRKVLSE